MPKSSRHKKALAKLQDEAWIGDSILGLYLRQLLLDNKIEEKAERGELYAWFSSNQFLSTFGRPTEVEARIGRIFQEEGLGAAFEYLTATILPVMQKQLENRRVSRRTIRLFVEADRPVI